MRKLTFGLLILGFSCQLVMQGCNESIRSKHLDGFNPAGIIGGTLVSADDPVLSTTVAIRARNGDEAEWFTCTGAIIAKNVVLTAAHCAKEDATLIISFGTGLSEEQIVAEYPVDAVELHEGNMGIRLILEKEASSRTNEEKKLLASGWNDLALIRFNGELPDGYQVATLSTDASLIQNGVEVIATGYGISEVLAHEFIDDGNLRKARLPIYRADYNATEFVVDQKQNRGTCRGDSGGPVYLQTKTQNILVGLVSHGVTGVQTCNGYAAITNIAAVRLWIEAAIVRIAKR